MQKVINTSEKRADSYKKLIKIMIRNKLTLTDKVVYFFIISIFILGITMITALVLMYYVYKIANIIMKPDFNLNIFIIIIMIFFGPTFWIVGDYIANLIFRIVNKTIGILTKTNISKEELKKIFNTFQKTNPNEFKEMIVDRKCGYKKYPELFPNIHGFALWRLINQLKDYHESLANDFLKNIGGMKRIYTIPGLINYFKNG